MSHSWVTHSTILPWLDHSNCESIMYREADLNSQRTLAVVTKVDRALEGLLEKVTVHVAHIGHGYVCV